MSDNKRSGSAGASTSKAKPKLKGSTKPKPKPKPKMTRKSSGSPQKPKIKKELQEEEPEPMVIEEEEEEEYSSDGDIQELRTKLTRLHAKEDFPMRNAGSVRRNERPKPYPIVYDGPIPRSLQDVDTAENNRRRNFCARLFNGDVEFSKDEDGLQECMLIEFPDLMPLDKAKLQKWKASEQKRIREGEPPVDYESDYDGMEDEERKQVVECCTPGDFDGMQVGELRCYEDGYVEYVCGGVRFEVTEGTDVIDRQDVYVANMNEESIDAEGKKCPITIYPMMTVKHRVIFAPKIDDLI